LVISEETAIPDQEEETPKAAGQGRQPAGDDRHVKHDHGILPRIREVLSSGLGKSRRGPAKELGPVPHVDAFENTLVAQGDVPENVLLRRFSGAIRHCWHFEAFQYTAQGRFMQGDGFVYVVNYVGG
jgi:hypothetical protein